MSILIQGMEMPKPFDHLFVGENLAGDLFVRNDTQEGDDVVWYPLVEIPPHGRLIDADDIVEKYGEPIMDHTGRTEWTVRVDRIQSAPTIISADKED